MPGTADASHGRYYHYTAQSAGGNAFDYTLNEGWRRDSLSCVDISSGNAVSTPCTGPPQSFTDPEPGVGDIVQSDNVSFSFGDGNSTQIYLLVTAISVQENSLTGVALDPAAFPAQDSTIRHTFATGGDFLGFAGTCCRISNLQNNADGSFRAEVEVSAGSTNSTPVSALPPVVRCPVGGTCSFLIPASDPNGDPMRFRMATDVEATGSLGGFTQPSGAAIDPNTGIYSFDTSQSRSGSPGIEGDLYSTQVVIEDLDGAGQPKNKVALDFIVQLVSGSGSSPTFAAPPSPCGGQIVALPGQQVSFGVQASDADMADTVELNAAGLPAGATMSPQLPVVGPAGGTVSSTFAWTPSAQATGNNVVTFTATDSSGRQTLCSVEILVNPVGVADVTVAEGQTANFTIAPAAPSDSPITVDYRTEPGTAVAGSDFDARSGTVTIPAGSSGVTVGVPTIDDSAPEPTEAFTLELSAAQGAPLGDRSGAGTITDSDVAGTPEPPAPPPPLAPLTVTIDPPSANRSEVERHTVTATVKRAEAPVEGQALRFRVTGPNPQTGSGITGAAGTAEFGWIGQSSGEDTAVAFVDENGDGEPQAAEPQATARVSWTGGLPPGIETASTIHGLPDPKLSQDGNFAPVGNGDVFVKLPGPGSRDPDTEVPNPDTDGFASQSLGKGFIPLREAAQLPVGTIIDADQGRIKVETAVRARSRSVQRADFFDGSFRFTQPRAANALTEMVMTGGRFRQTCAVSKRRSSRRSDAGPEAGASARRQRGGRTVRRLWGSGKGRFRTRGRYSSATVRGTRWVVEDRCEGTLTRVRTGTVTVRDFPRSRTVTVTRGRSYFAARRTSDLTKP